MPRYICRRTSYDLSGRSQAFLLAILLTLLVSFGTFPSADAANASASTRKAPAGSPGDNIAQPSASSNVASSETIKPDDAAENSQAFEDPVSEEMVDEFLLDDAEIDVDVSLDQDTKWNPRHGSTPPEHTYSIDQVIAMAVANSHALTSAQFEIKVAEARQMQAWGLWIPKIKVASYVAPVPSYDAPGSKDVNDFLSYDPDIWELDTVTSQTEVQLTQPVFTFGRITLARDLAKQGLRAARLKELRTRGDIIYMAQRAYYTFQFLDNLISVLSEGLNIAQDSMTKLKGMIERGSESVTTVDIYKLQVVVSELKVRLKDAELQRDLLLSAIRVLVGLPPGSPLYLASTELQPEEFSAEALDVYVEYTFIHRPDAQLLNVGYEALLTQERLRIAEFLPFLGIRAWFGYAYTPDAYNPENPYLKDNFNYTTYGVVLGLTWELDPVVQVGKYREAKYQRLKFAEDRKYARLGISLEVQKAYDNVVHEQYALEVNRNSHSAGKSWLVAATMNYSIGLSSTSDVIEAIGAFAKTQITYYQAIYDYNVAVANLHNVTGAYSDRKRGSKEGSWKAPIADQSSASSKAPAQTTATPADEPDAAGPTAEPDDDDATSVPKE